MFKIKVIHKNEKSPKIKKKISINTVLFSIKEIYEKTNDNDVIMKTNHNHCKIIIIIITSVTLV